ncbi:MAG: hypothetical protein PUA49_04905 [Butyrivibrio sp.]|nr:hypothetical protein [Butyrivibrio sp.]
MKKYSTIRKTLFFMMFLIVLFFTALFDSSAYGGGIREVVNEPASGNTGATPNPSISEYFDTEVDKENVVSDVPKDISFGINVAAYNLYAPMAGMTDLDKVKKVLAGKKYDIIGLCELSNNWYDNFTTILNSTDYSLNAVGHEYSGSLGVGVLYRKDRFSLIDSHGYYLSKGRAYDGGEYGRYCIANVFEEKETAIRYVYIMMHIEWADYLANAVHAKQVYDIAKQYYDKGFPVIIAGDINTDNTFYLAEDILTAGDEFFSAMYDNTYIGDACLFELPISPSTYIGYINKLHSIGEIIDNPGLLKKHVGNGFSFECEEVEKYYKAHKQAIDSNDYNALTGFAKVINKYANMKLDHIFFNETYRGEFLRVQIDDTESKELYKGSSDHKLVSAKFVIHDTEIKRKKVKAISKNALDLEVKYFNK